MIRRERINIFYIRSIFRIGIYRNKVRLICIIPRELQNVRYKVITDFPREERNLSCNANVRPNVISCIIDSCCFCFTFTMIVQFPNFITSADQLHTELQAVATWLLSYFVYRTIEVMLEYTQTQSLTQDAIA